MAGNKFQETHLSFFCPFQQFSCSSALVVPHMWNGSFFQKLFVSLNRLLASLITFSRPSEPPDCWNCLRPRLPPPPPAPKSKVSKGISPETEEETVVDDGASRRLRLPRVGLPHASKTCRNFRLIGENFLSNFEFYDEPNSKRCQSRFQL